MWTITNEQLERISKSMKQEFKDYAHFMLNEKCVQLNIHPEDFQTIIEKQIINIEKYSITEAECAIKLIELAMKFPVLNQEILPQQIEVIFNSEMSQSEKINNIESILISVI